MKKKHLHTFCTSFTYSFSTGANELQVYSCLPTNSVTLGRISEIVLAQHLCLVGCTAYSNNTLDKNKEKTIEGDIMEQ